MAWIRGSTINGGGGIPCLFATGKQYIDTGITGNTHPKIKFKLFVPYQQGSSCLASAWSTTAFFCQIGGTTLLYFASNNNSVSATILINEWNEIEIGADYIIVNGVTYSVTGGSYSNNENIKLFGVVTSYGELGQIGISEIEMYDNNDNLLRHYIPKKDATTGNGYFYDSVNQTDNYSATATPLIYLKI